MAPTTADLLAHAREFTDIEDLTLDLWNELQDKGFHQNARSLLDAGLMFEHFTSLLPNAVSDRTAEQVTQQLILRGKLDDEVRQALQVLNVANQTPSVQRASNPYYPSGGT